MKPRAILKDIAKASGLDLSTVSRALRNTGTVSQHTRRRLQALAREMGYRPNPVIASMAAKRRDSTKSLAVPLALIDVKSGLIPRSAHVRAQALGYRLELFRIEQGREAELARVLYNRGFVGIILGQLYGYQSLPDLKWEHFSVVKIGEESFPVPFHHVRSSPYNAIRVTWREIRRRGYKRIGAILYQHDPVHPDDGILHGAVLHEQTCLGPDEIAIPPLRCGMAEVAPIPKWFRRHRPDAVLAYHAGAYYALRDAGVPIGAKVGFASLNLDPDAEHDFSGILSSSRNILRHAVDLIDLQLRHNVYGPVEEPTYTLITASWREGKTLS